MRTRLSLGIAVVVMSGALAGCSSSSSSTPTTTTLPSALDHKSGAAVIALISAAMLAQGSVTVNQNVTFSGQSATTDLQSALSQGVETFGGAAGTGTVTMIKADLYTQGDATFLQNQFSNGTNVAAYANKAIKVAINDPNYKSIAQGVLLPAFLLVAMPTAPFSIGGVTTYDGQRALKVSGQVNPTFNSGGTGTVTYYISLKSPFLPLGATGTLSQSGNPVSTTIKFSNWGQPVTATAPANAVVSTSTSLG